VEVNDLVFVTHAVLMTSVTIYQCVKYKLQSHTLNKWHLYLVCAFWLLLAYNLAICAGGVLPFVNRSTKYTYSVVEFMGYVKVCISFVKYCPQAYMNFARKSTMGFAVGGVLLDLTGGLTALGQQSLDAYREGNTSQFTSNAAKLLLSLESIAFDLLFLFQHFVLYRAENRRLQEQLNAVDHPLTREEQEALEAETQAKAKAHAAALIGAVVGADNPIVRRLSGSDEHAPQHPRYLAVDQFGVVNPGQSSPGPTAEVDDAVENGYGTTPRRASNGRAHLLQQPARDSSDGVF